jgi:eukaryotic-like serine/threonine-protein kinase
MVNQQLFLENLRQSQLLSSTQLAEVDRLSAAGPSLEEFTTELVGQGWLTPFQVEKIVAGQGRGLVCGQYRILDELGRGGFGCVYKAMHGIMNRVVALKVIAPELVEDSRARSWFRREVLATTQLYHPNIVMAYDANEVDDALFLVMEYVEGPNLDQMVRQQGPLPIGLACAMLHQVGRALHYAHEKGMVHRDIKPANLLIPQGAAVPADPAGGPPLVKVGDFGLARLRPNGSNTTLNLHNDKGFVGTPAYISPEQARCVHEVDIRSDLYSLGCTFYYALSGHAPFRGQTALQTVMQHLEKEAEPLGSVRPEVPAALVSILRRLMAKKPEQRFQTPADLLAELSFLCGSQPVLALGSPPVSRPPDPPLQNEKRPSGIMPQVSLMRSPVESASSYSGPAACEANDPGRTRVITVEPTAEQSDPTSLSDELSAADGVEPEAKAPIPAALQASDTLAGDAPEDEAAANPPVTPTPIDRVTQDCWTEWLAMLEETAEGKKPNVGVAGYRMLHCRLMASIREADRRQGATAEWQRLESLVVPWLTLETLTTTDIATLADLHRRCQTIAWSLGLTHRPWSGRSWATLAATLLFAVCLGALFFQVSALPGGLSALSISSIWKTAIKSPYLVIFPPLVLACMFLLPRQLWR